MLRKKFTKGLSDSDKEVSVLVRNLCETSTVFLWSG